MEIQNLMVTGGCGFIGSNFIHHLLAKPEFRGRIVNVDKLTYAGNPENLSGLDAVYPGRYVFVKADICDAGRMKEIFLRHDIDAICHFAAESHVDRSIKRPESFIHTNIIGTFNLLEIARENRDRFRIFHHISTDEVYGSLGPQGLFTEETPYRPNSPYSASKAASDHLVRAYHETFGVPTTLSNCSNNYGPYQFPEKLIPLIITNALADRELPVYGDGLNVRDWIHVKDHCAAIDLVVHKGQPGNVYNIGASNERTNIEIVKLILAALEKPESLIRYVKDRPGHDRRYAIDSGKITAELGYRPSVDFAQGMRETVEWYVNNKEWWERIKTGAYLEYYEKMYGNR